MRIAALVVTLLYTMMLCGDVAVAQHFPERIDPSCRWGKAKVYDECGSQMVLLEKAKSAAEANGKVVLVVVGAEWCVWCHSFYQTINGMSGETVVYHEGEAYEMGELRQSRPELADELAAYAKETFVIVGIEREYSEDWNDVLVSTGAPDLPVVPYIYSLKDGRIAATLRWEDELPGIEIRSDSQPFYRGYDRAMLLSELKRLAEAAN